MPANPPLAYFVEEDSKIYLNVKTDQTGLIRFQIPIQKAANEVANLSGMLARCMHQQKGNK